MKTIQPAALQKLLDADSGLSLLDVRTPVEFKEAHVPQAFNEPLDELGPKALVESGKISRDRPFYILCRSGARAAKAADQFSKEGFSNAVVVEGGTLAWIEAGLPVDRGQTKVISLERQVRIAAGTLVLAGLILSQVLHPAFIWLSAFVGAGLVFAGITDFCGMGLLLAKFPWNRR